MLAYLIAEPHAADLAAAAFRGDLFAREGFTVFSTAWYGGHHTPGYSILAPPLGALVGERVLGGLSAIAATAAFTALAGRTAGLLFVPAILASLVSGRIAFTLGAALAIAAVLALVRGRTALALIAAVLTALSSPVASMFLALIAAALYLTKLGRGQTPPQFWGARSGEGPDPSPVLGMGVAAVLPTALLVLAFPEGGTFPFVASSFWPAFAAALAVAVVAPPGPLKLGAALYALLLAAAFAFDTPVGGNAVRLGTLTAAPIAYLLLWPHRRLALALLALPLAYWVLQPAVRDVMRTIDDPSVEAAYHRPLVEFLEGRGPLRVEIPLTQNHGEAEHVAREVAIGRGWLRQLDLERNGLFYEDGPLSPERYLRWLRDNAIGYVALPEGLPLDASGEEEKLVIQRGVAFLRPVARRGRWRIYAVRGARPLASPPARMTELGATGFSLRFDRAGTSTVRVRHTPYWELTTGRGCVAEAPGGWTEVRSDDAGPVEVRATLGSVFRRGATCSSG